MRDPMSDIALQHFGVAFAEKSGKLAAGIFTGALT
jgi:hypothetical protein